MKYKIDHDYHIHSCLSPCSGDPNQTPERILREARESGFTSICITDHFWDSAVVSQIDKPGFYEGLDYEHISKSLPLPQSEDTRFYFGCECDLLRDMTLGISTNLIDKMDLVVISSNHFHMGDPVLAEEDRPLDRRAKVLLNRLRGILDMDIPHRKFGIAHLTDFLMAPATKTDHIEVVNMWPEDDLKDIFGKAAKLGVGIELNIEVENYTPDQLDMIMRPYRIAAECGCKFYLGSDVHQVGMCGTMLRRFNRIVDMLSLEEEQKFHIPERKS